MTWVSSVSEPLVIAGSRGLGVDVGGTKVLGVLVEFAANGTCRILDRVEVPVARNGPGTAGDLAGQLAGVARQLMSDVGGGGVTAAGIGVAGYVSLNGAVVVSPNVPQAVGIDFGAVLGQVCGVEPFIDNDANCVATAALAWRRPTVDDLLVVTLGTGIGGAVVSGGTLIRGAHGFAGEPGHMVVVPDGLPCVCGQNGCWERYASGSALARMAETAIGPTSGGSAGAIGGSAELLVESARRGDPGAVAVMGEFAGHIADGLGNLINILDPEIVVLGGGVSRALDVITGPLLAELSANPTVRPRLPVVELAPFGEAAGAVGAATAAASV